MNQRKPKIAFTLLELVVVMVIIALTASLVTLSLRAHFDHAALSRSYHAAIEADRQARVLARSAPNGIVRLELDARASAIVLQPSDRKYKVPAEVEAFTIFGNSMLEGSASVPFYANGSSPSYAIRFQRGKASRWLVVLGISGQCIACDDLDTARDLMS